MSKPAPSPLQTTLRLAIMLGTLTVGSMAYYQFGPEAGELAEMIDHAASMVAEVQNRAPSEDTASFAAISEPAPFDAAGEFQATPESPAPNLHVPCVFRTKGLASCLEKEGSGLSESLPTRPLKTNMRSRCVATESGDTASTPLIVLTLARIVLTG
ncbi:MAG: hypothetical protein AAF266_03315 [Planctomycetota bacterium]